MKESQSNIRVNIKRLTLLLGLGIVALLLSVLPKDKKVAEGKKYMGGDGAGESALIPTARADDVGIISLTGGGSSCSCQGSGK
ncbi:MAG: hypothetical protein HY001_02660 [Candidatus Portnoybacteria bacterium]|nr:hypothetical protein [Candidatus Portnoybacteria bacterium]